MHIAENHAQSRMRNRSAAILNHFLVKVAWAKEDPTVNGATYYSRAIVPFQTGTFIPAQVRVHSPVERTPVAVAPTQPMPGTLVGLLELALHASVGHSQHQVHHAPAPLQHSRKKHVHVQV